MKYNKQKLFCIWTEKFEERIVYLGAWKIDASKDKELYITFLLEPGKIGRMYKIDIDVLRRSKTTYLMGEDGNNRIFFGVPMNELIEVPVDPALIKVEGRDKKTYWGENTKKSDLNKIKQLNTFYKIFLPEFYSSEIPELGEKERMGNVKPIDT